MVALLHCCSSLRRFEDIIINMTVIINIIIQEIS